jgi:hypothetical protein
LSGIAMRKLIKPLYYLINLENKPSKSILAFILSCIYCHSLGSGTSDKKHYKIKKTICYKNTYILEIAIMNKFLKTLFLIGTILLVNNMVSASMRGVSSHHPTHTKTAIKRLGRLSFRVSSNRRNHCLFC